MTHLHSCRLVLGTEFNTCTARNRVQARGISNQYPHYLLAFEAEWAPSGGRSQAQARLFRGLYSAPPAPRPP